jgi:uncharacterized protein (UPF0276 family)
MLSTDNACPRVGIGFRAEIFDALADRLHLVDVLEVTAEHYIYGNRRVCAMIESLKDRVPIVAHGVTLSVGTAVLPDRTFLREIAAFVRLVGAPWYSEHLAFTKTPSRDLSQLLPLVRTDDVIEMVSENLAVVHEELRMPIVLENVAYYFEYPDSEMSEFDFLLRTLTRARCGLLLDVENLRINAANHGYDAKDALRALPPGIVRAVHVAGGTILDGVHVDSHDSPVSDETLALLTDLMRLQRPECIVIERDQEIADVDQLFADVHRVREAVGQVWS